MSKTLIRTRNMQARAVRLVQLRKAITDAIDNLCIVYDYEINYCEINQTLAGILVENLQRETSKLKLSPKEIDQILAREQAGAAISKATGEGT